MQLQVRPANIAEPVQQANMRVLHDGASTNDGRSVIQISRYILFINHNSQSKANCHGHITDIVQLRHFKVKDTGPQNVAPAVYYSQCSIPTHVAEVVSGVFPLAELAVQPE